VVIITSSLLSDMQYKEKISRPLNKVDIPDDSYKKITKMLLSFQRYFENTADKSIRRLLLFVYLDLPCPMNRQGRTAPSDAIVALIALMTHDGNGIRIIVSSDADAQKSLRTLRRQTTDVTQDARSSVDLTTSITANHPQPLQ